MVLSTRSWGSTAYICNSLCESLRFFFIVVGERATMNRPAFFEFTFYDPWTKNLVLRTSGPYDCREAANGYYSRFVRVALATLPKIQYRILEGRRPSVSCKLFDVMGRKWVGRRQTLDNLKPTHNVAMPSASQIAPKYQPLKGVRIDRARLRHS